MKALDTSQDTRKAIPCLREKGIVAVGRYYSRSAWKRLTRPEAEALSAAGIAIWAVYQDAGNAYERFDAARGRDQARRALAYARDIIGQPAGSAIYFAVDYDASPKEVRGGIKDYFAAIAAMFAADGAGYRVGVYGNGAACAAMLDAGLADLAWLSMSTGHHGHRAFSRSRRWALRQRPETKLCGLGIDPNDLGESGDYGGFRLAVPRKAMRAAAAAPPPPPA